MKSFAAALSLLALALPIFSVPTKVPIPAAVGPIEQDSYIMYVYLFLYSSFQRRKLIHVAISSKKT